MLKISPYRTFYWPCNFHDFCHVWLLTSTIFFHLLAHLSHTAQNPHPGIYLKVHRPTLHQRNVSIYFTIFKSFIGRKTGNPHSFRLLLRNRATYSYLKVCRTLWVQSGNIYAFVASMRKRCDKLESFQNKKKQYIDKNAVCNNLVGSKALLEWNAFLFAFF